jgi:thioredoxin 1|tara:strand:+ start:133 stop:378 length:246 start_codon:yes stop_codon:yes gene_type:complete
MKQILYFSAGWCGPCRQLSPLMESLKDQINYQKVDVDKQQDLSMKYNIRNIPTLILLENGEVKDRTVGNQTPQSILNFYNG